jgi:hypothetical protein
MARTAYRAYKCRVRLPETDKMCAYLDNPLTVICLVSNFICNY